MQNSINPLSRVAVIGWLGQLGGELCRQLGDQALPLDRADVDITDRGRVLALLTSLRPTAVINTAAYTLVDQAEENRELCFAINATGVQYLTEACATLDCPLLQISTDYVFGGENIRQIPYRETDQPAPQGVYGQSKLAGEVAAQRCSRHFVVRTCGLYGQRGANTLQPNFVDTMLRLGRERGRLRVVGDQHCTPSYVPHVAEACRYLLSTTAYGTYHVVNHGSTTWYEFAAEIFRQDGSPVALDRITTAEYGAKAPRPGYSVLDCSKYLTLGGPPLPSWQAALAEYLASRNLIGS